MKPYQPLPAYHRQQAPPLSTDIISKKPPWRKRSGRMPFRPLGADLTRAESVAEREGFFGSVLFFWAHRG